MRSPRALLLLLIAGACAGADLRCDPSPSCSYREGRAEVGDAGRAYTGEITDLVLGQRHACAAFDDDDARCWGGNDLGQLSGRYDPRPGEGLTYDGWPGRGRLVAGGAHTCAFTRRGAACWGNDAAGQVAASAEPVVGVVAVDTGIESPIAASAGLVHTCAADYERVRCWGHNGAHQLGRDTEVACCHAPSDVAGVVGTVTLAAGAFHTCAIVRPTEADAPSVICWGDDRYGALGDGEAGGSRGVPEAVPLDGPASALTAGPHHTCALLEDERVTCWGRGASGELGDGLGRDSATPVAVALPPDTWQLVAGGRAALSAGPDGQPRLGDGVGRTCATGSDGRALCWGDNAEGQLGDGTTVGRLLPTEVQTAAPLRVVVPGGDATCALTVSDQILCWGDGRAGQTGSAEGSSATPAPTTVMDL